MAFKSFIRDDTKNIPMKNRVQFFVMAMALIAPMWMLGVGVPVQDVYAAEKKKAEPKTERKKFTGGVPVNFETFKLGSEDVLIISVWDNPDLKTVLPVRPDGYISFPLIGEVKAKGHTPNEVRDNINEGLKSYITNPNVTVVVKEINSIKYFITGEVNKPGTFKLNRPITLLHLFSLAEGFTEKADLRRSYLMRDGKKLSINFYDLVERDDFSQNVQLKNNDLVYVHDNFDKRVNIMGEVEKPKVVDFREGLTVLDAVLMAEGLTEIARPSAAMVYRKIRNKQGQVETKQIEVELDKVIFDGDLSKNIPLYPGDIIHIPRSFF